MDSSELQENSTTVASDIGCNGDLLSEILSHLPARTLLRFKSVSKKWMSVISDKQFAIEHSRTTHYRAPCGLFLYSAYPQGRIKTVSIPLFENPPSCIPPLPFQLSGIEILHPSVHIQSCNGLLLFMAKSQGCRPAIYHCVICNPTIKDFKVLPMPPGLVENCEWIYGLTLVFNPSESHYYKVVCIGRFRSEDSKGLWYKPEVVCKVQIYSSETNSWKVGPIIEDIESNQHKGVFLNGIVYWIGWKYMHYYNLNSEEFRRLPMPPLLQSMQLYKREISFQELCGCLYLVVPFSPPALGCSIIEFDHLSMEWSEPKDLLANDCVVGSRKPKEMSLIAVAKGQKDKDLVLLLSSCSSRFIIFNTVLRRQVESYATPEIYLPKTCEYIPCLVPV